MSALAAPPSPRLRLVPAAPQARRATEPVVPPRAPHRSHLRLVASRDGAGTAGAQASQAVGGDRLGPAPAALPVELRRRPAPPRVRGGSRTPALSCRRSRARTLPELSELAPNHPAVRVRRRRLEAGEQARAASGAVTPGTRRPGAEAQAPTGTAVPAVLRGLVTAALTVLVVAAIVAGGILASGVSASPTRTTTTTLGRGESLWDVAVATGAHDVSEAMAQIAELNGLTSSTLEPGQVLLVPAG